MPRFRASEVEHYGGQGGAGYFSLKDNGDVAQVRFMMRNIDDLEGYAVHQVEIDGRKRYVNCLREYNQPIDDCPFCRARMFQTAKFFIPIYNLDEDKVQVWERGKKFASQMSSLMARYSSPDRDFCSQVFEIERQGKKGDTATTYGIFPVGQPDDTTLEDLDELPNILGGLILDKSVEDMEYFLEDGVFPPTDNAPVRRRGAREETARTSERDSREERREVRRTPASRRRGEDF